MPFTALAYLAHWIERSVLACEIVSSTQSSTSISFFYCADSYCKTRAHYIVMCYSEQYVRLKRNVFSPRRKADVDCVLFSTVGSWFHVYALGAEVENARSAVFRFVNGTI